jgi:predicted dehydrogenase/threonine dehydrogenase-like Zn-dependent dehydrogenase
MKQVLVSRGDIQIADVPTPNVGPSNVLVRVQWSCISAGTEIAGVRLSALPLYRRALKQPEHVRKVLELMRDHGVKRTWDRIAGKLGTGTPLGYAASGRVIAIGRDVDGFRVGDLVACAGAGIANHAEVIDVPVNLAVHVPPALGLDIASTATLGAIALQGVRRAEPMLGETFVVVGLGILGQLAIQLLKANGCTVIAADVEPERIAAARASGAAAALDSEHEDYVAQVLRITEGHGADGVLVTAASSSDGIISEAFNVCRKKGRVVLVGDVGLNLRRSDLYEKELDFRVSTSYGPGRYDPNFEEGGRDYPIAYVRWTETRNMQAYLALAVSGAISLKHLSEQRFDIADAEKAYATLRGEGPKPLLVLLRYPDVSITALQRKVVVRVPALSAGRINTAVIGAGNFALGTHLPNLKQLKDKFAIHCVMSRTGLSARAAVLQWQGSYATTDFEAVLEDRDVELVIIATRHHLHADLALRALRAGKHVLLEKPLAINSGELDSLKDHFSSGADGPVLMTGFNRRFSPGIRRIAEILASRTAPMIINYRMNAGYLAADHWLHGQEGGGRNIGEACHIYDLFGYLTGAPAISITARGITSNGKQWRSNDNFVATIGYADGSVCSLTYAALGDKAYAKERMDIFCDGKVLFFDNYKKLEVYGGTNRGWNSMTQEKGQLEELIALAACLREGRPWPIPLQEQFETTRISFEVEKLLRLN